MSTTLDKFRALRATLNDSLIDRSAEVDAMLLGLVAQEHVLLIGPPGTGKSMLSNNITKAITKAQPFSILLTKFTTPEEVFGPIKLTALREDRYERAVDAYMPKAHIAFIDEIWKASSAILNTMLTILQERTFDNGGTRHACPLRLAIAASNEWPSAEDGQELGAVFDRFPIRRVVRPVSPANRDALLYGVLPPVPATVDIDDIDRAHDEAFILSVSDGARAAFTEIIETLTTNGIRPGDRRMRKAIGIAKAAAWLDGSSEVLPIHLECLDSVLWSSPEQIDKTADIVLKIANPLGAAIADLVREVADIEQATAGANDAAQQTAAIKKYQELEARAADFVKKTGSTQAKAVEKHVIKARVTIQARMLGMSPERAARFMESENA